MIKYRILPSKRIRKHNRELRTYYVVVPGEACKETGVLWWVQGVQVPDIIGVTCSSFKPDQHKTIVTPNNAQLGQDFDVIPLYYVKIPILVQRQPGSTPVRF
jgi:hypothetical protein